MQDENTSLRNAYVEKYFDAFDEDVAFGGKNAEFILFKPVRVKGWGLDNGVSTGPFEHEF